ncbi:dTMP kinase [Micromonospora sp. DT62]|uniref:dTMP kinase n=1 Tax=Micromonospora sp. DT62 TaxID=3416521 RepID=UPI003CF459A1
MNPDRSGMLITIDGIDGSGKSTLASALAAHLSAAGRPAVVHRPVNAGQDGLPALRRVASFAGTRDAGVAAGLDIYALHLTYAFVAYAVDEVVPALAAGTTVICDRYVTSHRANQAVFGVDLSSVEPLLRSLPAPDHEFHLRLAPEDAKRRIALRAGAAGVFDGGDLLARAAEAFDAAADGKAHRIDASADPDAILRTVVAILDGGA